MLRQYGVEIVPTLFILASDDKEVDRLVDLTDMKLEHFLQFLNQSIEGRGTYRALSEAFVHDENNIDIAYRLLKKHVQRGDVKGVLSMGRRLLDVRGQLADKPSIHPEEKRRSSMETDVLYEVRVGLNRSSKEIVLSHIHQFPEVRFSERLYRFTARHLIKGDPSPQAKEFFQTAVSVYPNSKSLNRYALAYAVHSRSNLDEAEVLAQQLIHESPEPEVLKEYAGLLLIQKRFDEAIKWYGPSLTQNYDTNPKILHEYAQFWLSHELNLKDALAAAQKAAGLWRKHAYFYTLALLHEKLSKPAEASEAIQKAISLSDGRIPEYQATFKRISSVSNKQH